MDGVWIILSVLVALFATWGFLSIAESLFAWFFAPVQVRGALFLESEKDLQDLEFLLSEAGKSCHCRKNTPILVILSAELADHYEDLLKELLPCHCQVVVLQKTFDTIP